MPSDDQLDLQTAADELGVHYQTAYRWVRSGKLPAQVIGGRYRVERGALDALATARVAPRAPSPPSVRRLAGAAERVHAALVTGDEPTARQVIVGLVEEGASIIEVIQSVIVPPLVRIGADWHAGRLTIWVEHRASAIVERILGGLAPNPRGRRRGTVMVAAVSGDFHSLPTSMAAVALRDDNWAVEHLGANMPPEELLRFCVEHDIDVHRRRRAVVDQPGHGVAGGDHRRPDPRGRDTGGAGPARLDPQRIDRLDESRCETGRSGSAARQLTAVLRWSACRP